MIWTLAATAAATATAAVVYAALARLLLRRPAAGDRRFALRAFAAYWAFTAAFQALVAVQHGLAAAGVAPFPLALGVRYGGLALAAAGLAGLLSYFAYIITGTRRWTPVIVAAYAASAALTWLHIWRSDPVGVAQTAWSVDVRYAHTFQSGLFLPLLVPLLVVPIAGAVWYLTLARAVEDPRQRARILAVGAGVALQLSAFLVARVVENEMWQLVSRTLLGIVVAALVAWAYRGSAGLHAPAGTPGSA